MENMFSHSALYCLSGAGQCAPTRKREGDLHQHGSGPGVGSPQPSPGKLTYTAGYKSIWAFRPVCQNQTGQSCVFTERLTNFGLYTFKVRAEFEGRTSQWVNTSEFHIDRDTLIGAPKVSLSSKAGNIRVDIQDPVTRVPDGLRRLYSSVCYNIMYWEESETEKPTLLECQQQISLVLSELKPKVRYCVQAQVSVPSYHKVSNYSAVTCETTTVGRAETWLIVVVMMSSLFIVVVTVTLLFLAVWYGYKGIKFMFPKAKLPEDLKQFLIDPPRCDLFLAMQNSSQPEEKCHEVCIVSELTEGAETEGTPL
ncbi:hypothetical protein COCON_G00047550 [Conger conger]|uniref:Interferon/interleukin receptor domain-containing protein n=1 Tax=Conger conger TaxID=82655 RepID=A0A9Q1DV07_CONCO|nr:hypothetical protein COCON_G00047550 [Conger conger]